MSPLLFLDISGGEFLVILFAVFLVFGPRKMPEIARHLGKGMNELKKVTSDLGKELQEGANQVKKEIDQAKEEVRRETHRIKEELMAGPSDVAEEIKEVADNSIDDVYKPSIKRTSFVTKDEETALQEQEKREKPSDNTGQ